MRFLLAGLLVMLAACQPAEPKAKPVPDVFVTPATPQQYHPEASFNARIESRSDVEIKAQVSGKLTAIHFTEGETVVAGAKLFDIDPAPFHAAVKKAEADLARAKAAETNAVRNFTRGKTLVKDGYISGAELDNLQSKQDEAIAAARSAEAALERAQVDLAYTTITASQAGKVGRSIRAVGDIVGPETGALTTLVGDSDMDVVFQLPETLLLSVRFGESGRPKVEDVELRLILPNGSEYSESGRITYLSNRIDAATGTVEVRGQLANPNGLLRPGMFARATLRIKTPVTALMVPQAAVQVDQRGPYVLIVAADNTVARKNIQTGERVGENVIVTTGLEEGAQVIVRGTQKARPGDTVKSLPFQPATAPSTGDAP